MPQPPQLEESLEVSVHCLPQHIEAGVLPSGLQRMESLQPGAQDALVELTTLQ
jgi:hypothetical protein